MVRVSPPTRSASSGELSELMFGRPDFVRYQNAARACRGFIPLPEGPFTRCPGTEMLGEIAGTGPARLMAFVFRDEDAMLLEWTDALLRFWRGGQLVQKTGADYSIATPYSAADAKRLQSLQSADRIYLTEGENAPQRLSRFALDDWSIEATPFSNGPFLGRNLDTTIEIKSSQVTGVAALVSTVDVFDPLHVGALFKLREIDASDTPLWTGETKAEIGEQFYNNGLLYEIAAFDANDGTTSTTAPTIDGGGVVTSSGLVIWTSIAQNNNGNEPVWVASELVSIGDRRFVGGWTIEVIGFQATGRDTGVNPPVHAEGRALTEKGGPIWEFVTDGSGVVQITAVTDAKNATANVLKRLPDGLKTRPTYRWSEGAWSDLRGWPRAIGAFQQRHFYGGSPTEPRTLWAGVIGGTTDMTANGLDDDGFSYIMATKRNRSGEIRWINDIGDALHVGTSGDELFGNSTDADRAFSEQTSRFDSDTAFGSADAQPVIIDGSPVFIHKNLRRLMSLAIDPRAGKFRGENLTQIARHILGSGVDRIVYQEDPVPIIWARGLDGDLVGLTYTPSQEVVGWHRHKLAGGFLEDIEVLPSDDGLSEHLHMVVRRTIDGQTRRFLERMHHPFVDLDGQDLELTDAWFQHCAVRYQGAAASELSGLDHLEGETVTAWTNLGAFTNLAVSGGAITLPAAVTSAITGLDATPDQYFDTMDIVVGTPDGGDEGRLRSHRATGVRVHQSAGGTFQVFGTHSGEQRETPTQPLFNLRAFEAATLRNGVFELAGHKGWNHQAWLRFAPEPGAPLTVVSRTPTMMITDD